MIWFVPLVSLRRNFGTNTVAHDKIICLFLIYHDKSVLKYDVGISEEDVCRFDYQSYTTSICENPSENEISFSEGFSQIEVV